MLIDGKNYYPMLMSPPLIEKTINGQKTVTRRVAKLPAGFTIHEKIPYIAGNKVRSPYGDVGDFIFIKESWATDKMYDGSKPSDIKKSSYNYPKVQYFCGESPFTYPDFCRGRKRSPLHMTFWASRIHLEITAVYVERVQEITSEHSRREGLGLPDWFPNNPWTSANEVIIWQFHELWDKLNKNRGYAWKTNPLVWVVEYKLHWLKR